jgi:hypothetical protein
VERAAPSSLTESCLSAAFNWRASTNQQVYNFGSITVHKGEQGEHHASSNNFRDNQTWPLEARQSGSSSPKMAKASVTEAGRSAATAAKVLASASDRPPATTEGNFGEAGPV